MKYLKLFEELDYSDVERFVNYCRNNLDLNELPRH